MAKQSESNSTVTVQITMMSEQRDRWDDKAKKFHYLGIQEWVKALVERAIAEDDAQRLANS